MDRLVCRIQHYDWGSTTAIAELQGRESGGEPEAELWIGAHPAAPSVLDRGDGPVELSKVIADAPEAELGSTTRSWFGDELPFLLKVLAADSPLSLQVHPTLEQAVAGFEREEAGGIPVESGERIFRDANHKPELLCALTRFSAMCGFRPVSETVELLTQLAVPELEVVVRMLSAEPGANGLRGVLRYLLELDEEATHRLVSQLAIAVAEPPEAFAEECAWIASVADRAPADPGVAVLPLLNLVVLEPGQALFLGTGRLHTYLGGVAVEVMANSDNVIRGGLTSKHVDVATLLEIVDPRAGAVSIETPGTKSQWTYAVPVPEFELTRIEVETRDDVGRIGPALVLVVDGSITIRTGHQALGVEPGHAVWVPASDGPVQLGGRGTVFLATVGVAR
ncbi:MAG: mannose-6-phosphate isomerase, class I [Acidimicrobiia bacterium]|nr:mannose-6-phosphate isomerase, class I [Acidimicrobiia bacterium]